MKTTGRWIAAAAMLAGTMALAQTVAPAGGDAGKERARPAGGDRGAAMMEQMSFEKMDANGDGKVTFEEFKAASEPMLKMRFDRMDENKDGFLSKEEVQKARENMHGRMGGGDRPARHEAGAAKDAGATKDAEQK